MIRAEEVKKMSDEASSGFDTTGLLSRIEEKIMHNAGQGLYSAKFIYSLDDLCSLLKCGKAQLSKALSKAKVELVDNGFEVSFKASDAKDNIALMSYELEVSWNEAKSQRTVV